MSSRARLNLLGELRLELGDAPGGAAVQRKRLALLAVVARAGVRGVSRDRLLALLWADQAPEDARRALVVALSALRRVLPEGALLPLAMGVALDPACIGVDVVEFEAALARGDRAAAVALYRGPFLDGVTLPGAPEFDRWIEEERAVLARRHVDTLAALAATARDGGDSASAVQWAQAWAGADPLGTRAAVALVDALAAAGDLSGAARAAQVHEALVRDELRSPPDPSVAAALARARAAPRAALVLPPPTIPPPAPPRLAEAALDTNAPAAGQASTAPAAGAGAAPQSSNEQARPSAGRRALAGGAIAVAAIVVAVNVPSADRNDGLTDRSRRVVVAPFVNETGDTALAPIGRMAADWIAHGLGSTGLVQVVPTTAAFAAGRYADSLATRPGADRARLLASETGAGLVVSGAVYRVGDSVQLRATIADGRDGHTIRELEPITTAAGASIPAVDRLRQRVLGALSPLVDERLATTAANSTAPPSYEAYRELTEGIRFVARSDFRSALPHFERAYALDTSFTAGLLHIALANANLGRYQIVDSLTRRLQPVRHRLTPYDATLLDAARAWTDGDWTAAYEAAKRGARIAPTSMVAVQVGFEAVRINRPHEAVRVLQAMDPTRGELRGYGAYWVALTEAYHLVGRYEDELRAARRSRTTEPLDPAPLGLEARALTALGRTAEALALIDVRLAMPWGNGPPPDAMMLALARELRAHGHAAAADTVWLRLLAWLDARGAALRQSPPCRACRGYALAGLGRATEAHAIFAALAEDDTTNLLAQRNLGVAAARTGDRATAARAAERLARTKGREVPVALYLRAQIAAELGDLSGATELLRESLGRGLAFSSTLFHASPELEPLRGYPPFQELVRPKG